MTLCPGPLAAGTRLNPQLPTHHGPQNLRVGRLWVSPTEDLRGKAVVRWLEGAGIARDGGPPLSGAPLGLVVFSAGAPAITTEVARRYLEAGRWGLGKQPGSWLGIK